MAEAVGARLGLGGAQLGMNYGIANTTGQPDETQVRDLLSAAAAGGIGFIDTAPAYGSSEDLIGRLRPADWTVKIVTKAPVVDAGEFTPAHGAQVVDHVEASLARLGAGRLHGVLIHHAGDLNKPGGEHLAAALTEIKARGWAEKIGFSAYTAEETRRARDVLAPDIVQLPLNLLDQRILNNGGLAELAGDGVEIHVRSVFLQGLLMMPPEELPPYFQPLAGHLRRLHASLHDLALSPQEAGLALILRNPDISAAVIGAETPGQLHGILSAAERFARIDADFSEWAVTDEAFIDPSNWPRPTVVSTGPDQRQ